MYRKAPGGTHPRRWFGLGGILTATGIGTVIEDGKQKISIYGGLLEAALRAEFALLHAFIADYLGNVSYALTARNFNPLIAMAAVPSSCRPRTSCRSAPLLPITSSRPRRSSTISS